MKNQNYIRFVIIVATLLIMIPCVVRAQDCEIHVGDDVTMPVCYKSEVYLSVDYNSSYTYQWKHKGEVISEGPSVTVEITENNSVYEVFLYDAGSGNLVCDNSITFTMRPAFDIHFEQLALTCSDKNADNGQTAKVRAEAVNTQGSSYQSFTYKWNEPIKPIQYMEDPQIAIGLKAYTEYSVTVTNEYGCQQTKSVSLKAYPNPNVEIFSDPKDTLYKDNPYITWWFENKETEQAGDDNVIEISNFFWEFESYENSFTEEEPEVSFANVTSDNPAAKLTVTNEQGCDTTFVKSITMLPVDLKIPNIFTPNGDGINDYFQIGYNSGDGRPINDLSEYFLSSKLVIFNRWGRKVYESEDYKNDWDGGNLSDGTYFYVLECKGETKDYRYQGSVMIWNSGR